jgi:hypothetical protein
MASRASLTVSFIGVPPPRLERGGGRMQRGGTKSRRRDTGLAGKDRKAALRGGFFVAWDWYHRAESHPFWETFWETLKNPVGSH